MIEEGAQLVLPPYLVPALAAAKRTTDTRLAWLTHRVLRAAARPLLRVVIGHWPRRHERADFHAGMAEAGALPPLMAGLARVERARPALVGATVAALKASAAPAAIRPLAGRPIGFLHLEKTGGSSLNQFIDSLYDPAQIGTTDALRGGPGDDPHGDTAARLLLRGHMDLPTLHRLQPDRWLFTILREPRARILSCYHYWRSHRPSSTGGAGVNEAAAAAARLDLLDFLQSDLPAVRAQIDNMYVNRLTGVRVPARHEGDGLQAAEQAVAALAGLGFVGLTEQMGDSLRLLARALGVPPPAREPRTNVTADNAADMPQLFRPVEATPITPAIEAELDRLTRLDRVVYASARMRFAAERSWVDG